MAEITFKFELDLTELDLNRSIEEVTGQVLRSIVEDTPGEIQELMATSSPSGKAAPGGGKHSAEGQVPAIMTRELFISLRGKLISNFEAEIQMAKHGFYLDPFFEGQGKGGGYLNRPFIEKGIKRSIARDLKQL